MQKVTVELDWDTVDNIIKDQLKDSLQNMIIDHANRKLGHGMAIFELDQEKDCAEMERHIEAFKTVFEYYGGSYE